MNKKKPFENLSKTKQFADGFNVFDAIKASMRRSKDIKPNETLPSVKTDLKNYYTQEPSIIWFGHSSYLIHNDGKNILVDPVLSGHASPMSFLIKAFEGTDIYKIGDMPNIDYLVLTHNHYDHLDYKALKVLGPCVRKMVIPSGVSKDLKGLSINPKLITELQWGDSVDLENGISITSTPARHFSGRGLVRNHSLWSSYVLTINKYKIFIGGDSGYDIHFKEIGNTKGPFDIALLECGQYDKLWPEIHSMPEEVVLEGLELKAKVILPIHWGKFALANHDWDEPINRFVKEAERQNVDYTTPMIGEPVVLGESYPKQRWWVR